MSTDYHSIKAGELVRGQVLLDRGSERKIVGIHKSPGRIYVYIQKDTKKAQLQFSPLEEVSVRNDSVKKQIFLTTSSNTFQPKTRVGNEEIAESHLPRSAFDLSTSNAELSPPHPELDLSKEAPRLSIFSSDSYYMEALQPKKDNIVGNLIMSTGQGLVTPLDHNAIHTPVFSPPPSAPQPYREHSHNAEDYVRVPDPGQREHNKTAIRVMRVGAATMLIGVLLAAFGMARGSGGAIVSWGSFLL